ncbi:hypothetical protein F4779DRAFT_174528 [Xylariaceae sp. FL0662B]|nr:hypothetical protein F4779DRAFT_174528 [Xylariaceae sp. FL0662B]
MDAAYKQHANQARRQNRSSTNVNHLSLAPLTSKLPLTDPEDLPEFVLSPLQHHTSYLQGKSAPTTPRLLRSPTRTQASSSRSSVHNIPTTKLPKSKSTTHLSRPDRRHGQSLASTPLPRHHDRSNARGRDDSDWVLRTGALISSKARESKGQAWLVSRESSTSLSGVRDAEEEAHERELARERELPSRRSSRRGSLVNAEGGVFSPNSRFGSRSHSRAGSRTRVRTPLERVADEGYFNQALSNEEPVEGPDFVGLDETLEATEIDTSQVDDATVRRLFNRKSAGIGAWMWSIFSVEENDEESDNADAETTDGETEESHLPRSVSTADFEDASSSREEQFAPPKQDGGGWQDAAWLLSVASKVLL